MWQMAQCSVNEAILECPAPVKPNQPTPWGAEMSHSCWGETGQNCQPTESWAIKGCFGPLSLGLICYTAMANWNKGFVQLLAHTKVRDLLSIHSKSKLSCQKWHLRTPHLISSLTSWQALQQLPTYMLGSSAGTQMLPGCVLCQADILLL